MFKLLEQMACKIPILDPFHNGFMKIIPTIGNQPLCMDKSRMKFTTDLNSTLIRVSNDENDWTNVTCCYFTFNRGKDDMNIEKYVSLYSLSYSLNFNWFEDLNSVQYCIQ